MYRELLYRAVAVVTAFLVGYLFWQVLDATGAAGFLRRLFG